MKNYCYIIILILFSSQNLMAQRFGRDMPPSSDPGSCHAKCLITAKVIYDEYEETYPIYIGDQVDSFNFEIIEIITAQGKTEWVKKQADRNCLSADPNDCQVWCLVEVPPTVMEIEVLVDTTLTKDFVYETFLIVEETVYDKGGHTEWREVVCNSDVKPKLIKQLQDALKKRGYLEGSDSKSKLSSKFKQALTSFQRHNNLPVGQLDFETLEALDIDSNRF